MRNRNSILRAVLCILFCVHLRASAVDPVLCLTCALPADVKPTTLPLKLSPNSHIILIGNALFERMQESGQFEALLHQRFPKHNLVIRTLAWPGDEVALRPRPDNFGDIHQHLAAVKADVIFAAYGFNESFNGPKGLPSFEHDLTAFIAELRTHKYNGKSPPEIVLVSPIPHENRCATASQFTTFHHAAM